MKIFFGETETRREHVSEILKLIFKILAEEKSLPGLEIITQPLIKPLKVVFLSFLSFLVIIMGVISAYVRFLQVLT